MHFLKHLWFFFARLLRASGFAVFAVVSGLLVVFSLVTWGALYFFGQSLLAEVDKYKTAWSAEAVSIRGLNALVARSQSVSGGDIFVAISAPRVVAALSAAIKKSLQEIDTQNSIKVKGLVDFDPIVELKQQFVSARVRVRVTSGEDTLDLEALVFGAPVLETDAIFFAANVAQLRVVDTSFRGNWFIARDEAVERVNKLLESVGPSVTATLAEFLNPLSIRLNYAPLLKGELKDLLSRPKPTDLTRFDADERQVYFNPALVRPLIQVTPSGLRVLSALRPRTEEEVKATADAEPRPLPPGDTLMLPPAATDVANAPARIQELSGRADTLLHDALHRFVPLDGSALALADDNAIPKSLLVVTARFVASTLNSEFERPVCGRLSMLPHRDEFDQDVSLVSPPGGPDCPSALEACAYKDVCTNQDACQRLLDPVTEIRERTEEVERRVCSEYGLVLMGPAACIATRIEKEVNTIREVVEVGKALRPGAPLFCKGVEKIHDRIGPVCTIASGLDQAKCAALSLPGSFSCEALKRVQDAFSSVPLARMHGNIEFKGGGGQVCLSAKLADDLRSGAIGIIGGNANADATVTVQIDPKPAGLLAGGLLRCYLPRHSIDLSADTTIANLAVPLVAGSSEIKKKTLTIPFAYEKANVPVSLNKGLWQILAEMPETSLTCSVVPSVAGAISSWVAVSPKDYEKIGPFISGKNIPQSLDGGKLPLQIEPIKDFLGAELVPQISATSLFFVES